MGSKPIIREGDVIDLTIRGRVIQPADGYDFGINTVDDAELHLNPAEYQSATVSLVIPVVADDDLVRRRRDGVDGRVIVRRDNLAWIAWADGTHAVESIMDVEVLR